MYLSVLYGSIVFLLLAVVAVVVLVINYDEVYKP